MNLKVCDVLRGGGQIIALGLPFMQKERVVHAIKMATNKYYYIRGYLSYIYIMAHKIVTCKVSMWMGLNQNTYK